MPRRPLKPPALAALLAALVLAAPGRAMFGLALGDQRLFFVEPALSEQDGELDASFDTQAPDLEFEQFEGAALGAAYGFAIHQAAEGVKARFDTYRVRAGLLPGPMKFFGKTLRLGFGMQAGAELRFMRHFPSAKDATKARPVAPWVLRSPDALLRGLRPGDMATLPVRSEFLLKAALSTPIAGIPARPSIFVKLGGTFQMSLLRLRDQKVRIRFLSMGTRTAGAGFKAGFVWDAELVEILGQDVRFLTELQVLKTSWTRRWGKGVLLDATLDLADPEAREAYELLVHRPMRFVKGSKALLSVGWTLVQELAERHAADPEGEPPVEVHSLGLMRFEQDAWKLKLGNSLFRWGRRELSTLLEFSPYRSELPEVVMASNLSVGKITRWFRRRGKWFFESRVYGTRKDGELRAELWSLRYKVKDLHFSAADLEDVRKKLAFQLGPRFAPVLDDLPADAELDRGKAEIRVRLGRRALEDLARFSEAELAERFDAWLERLQPGLFWRQGHAFGMIALPRELHTLLQAAVHAPTPEVLRDLADLRDTNRAFGSVGTGFLLDLLQPTEDDDRVEVYVRYKSVTGGKIKRFRGSVAPRDAETTSPLMLFLETGILELQRRATEVALEAREGLH